MLFMKNFNIFDKRKATLLNQKNYHDTGKCKAIPMHMFTATLSGFAYAIWAIVLFYHYSFKAP
jgi:hypothetical protein